MTPEHFASTVFDYVIVGGGTAGLVLAARLTEDPNVTAGVIEAGEWNTSIDGVNIPGMCGSTLANPQYDWAFMSVPQKHANNRLVYQPRGKGLGGSSMINLLGFARASSMEYDAIEALGNPGWNWESFLKYLKKSETTLPLPTTLAPGHSLTKPDTRWHGDSGPVVKSYSTHFSDLHVPFLDALENLGVEKNLEPGNGNTVGSTTTYAAVDSRNATRSYAANSYYAPNAARPNLKVLTSAVVLRVNFRAASSPLIATGVQFKNGGRNYTVSAQKEVLLCAGAFQSPQILELSGIGNKEILKNHGIETLVSLPGVGENLQLQDHPYVSTIHEIDPTYETIDLIRDPEEVVKQQELYKSQGGWLASALAALYAFLPTKAFATTEQINKWKAMAQKTAQEAPRGLKRQLEVQSHFLLDPASAEGEVLPFPGFFIPSGLQPAEKLRYSSMVCAIMHPFSRGSVHIASADPTMPPSIDPNYFSNPIDMEIMLAIVKFALKLYETSPIGELVRQQISPTVEQGMSDEALVEFIKNSVGCEFHPLGTAVMMPREDDGVVDPELKVYGTANLRVVDASILPMELATHVQATVYALAEKAADIIKHGNV